ncbi:MAG: isocitrate lyase/phosphoenolpyruvate mutase family protein [Pseudogulbenkiania sp.]|nr:isocitrate lyase/phosphoenolpyruvate mutase family protein [Pseudogulbenkiania sp.]
MDQLQKALRFQDLHRQDGIFRMPNAWDAGSARMLSASGFPAIATTSAGIAFSLGLPDYEGAVSRETMLERIRQIAAAVDLPVSADLEAGYGVEPEQVGDTIRLAMAAGVVGGNIEDFTGERSAPLFGLDLAAERIRAAREAADASAIPFTLTARTDCYLAGVGNPFAAAVERANRYREAGADCLFVPGVSDPDVIAALVKEIDGPLTVVMGLSGSTLSVSQLAALGVRRVTIGGSLARATYGLIRQAASEMKEQGSFSFADRQIPDGELCRFFASFPSG